MPRSTVCRDGCSSVLDGVLDPCRLHENRAPSRPTRPCRAHRGPNLSRACRRFSKASKRWSTVRTTRRMLCWRWPIARALRGLRAPAVSVGCSSRQSRRGHVGNRWRPVSGSFGVVTLHAASAAVRDRGRDGDGEGDRLHSFTMAGRLAMGSRAGEDDGTSGGDTSRDVVALGSSETCRLQRSRGRRYSRRWDGTRCPWP